MFPENVVVSMSLLLVHGLTLMTSMKIFTLVDSNFILYRNMIQYSNTQIFTERLFSLERHYYIVFRHQSKIIMNGNIQIS